MATDNEQPRSRVYQTYYTGGSSIQAFYGPYNSLTAAVDYFNTTVTKIFPTVHPGFPVGIVENGVLTAEYVFTGLPSGDTTITKNHFVKRFPPVPSDFIEVVEDGIYNIDKNFTAEPVGNAIVGGGSDSGLESRVSELENRTQFNIANIS